jgi:hypothetical protein
MLLTPWQTLKAIVAWLRGTPEVPPAPPTPETAPAAPPIPHKIASAQIVAGNVIVMNTGTENVRLEGPVLRLLFLRAGDMTTIKSPLLEPVWRIKSVTMEPPRENRAGELPGYPKVASVDKEIVWINEWDALEVVENMIEEYARARAYDMMTPSELTFARLPLSKEALQPIIERLGLKAQRENENVPAQA